ncbi:MULTISPECIES: hypothetical protein [unclassified Nonomuraea]|uniref:hypothetical protein n=1 Tax=unclassified Nonomuraea TaxID=2593643 RepID=UPI0035BF6D7D
MKSLNLELLELEAATFEVVDSLDPSMDMMVAPDAVAGACSSSCSCSSCCSCSTSSCCSTSSSTSSCA